MKKNCLVCNKEIKSSPSRNSKYCSKKCFGISITGQISWNKNKHFTAFEKKCSICNKEFFTTPSRIAKGQGKYCNRECFYKSREGKNTIPWLNIPNRKTWNKGMHIQSNTGRTHFKKGNVPWTQGKHHNDETKRQISEKLKTNPNRFINAKKAWEVNKLNGFLNRVGKRHSLETRIQISVKKRDISLEEFDGFTMSINRAIRGLSEYKQWQQAILKRDDYTCLICGERGGRLHIDHILAFSVLVNEAVKIYGKDLELIRQYPKFWDLSNGRTLCKDCHRNTDNWGSRARWQLFKQI